MKANVSSPSVVNISDLRLLAEKRVPRMVFDYIDSGADREQTLSQNCTAYNEILFRPKCAVATPSCDLTTSILNQEFQLPFMLAPVGSSRLFFEYHKSNFRVIAIVCIIQLIAYLNPF